MEPIPNVLANSDIFSFVDQHTSHRKLNHYTEDEELMDNEDDTYRAERDENGMCVHYEETLEMHFIRIARRLRKNDET